MSLMKRLNKKDALEDIIRITGNIAKGRYSNDILEYTKPLYNKDIQRIAEAVGLMMVKIEAREIALKETIEKLNKELAAKTKSSAKTKIQTPLRTKK